MPGLFSASVTQLPYSYEGSDAAFFSFLNHSRIRVGTGRVLFTLFFAFTATYFFAGAEKRKQKLRFLRGLFLWLFLLAQHKKEPRREGMEKVRDKAPHNGSPLSAEKECRSFRSFPASRYAIVARP